MKVSAPLLALLLALTSCNSPTSEDRVAKLEARMVRLEAQVARLRQSATQAGTGGTLDSDSQLATDRAAAQYCATQLASTLEEYRQDNSRYPAMSGVVVPRACQGYRVDWTRLEAGHYRFQVNGQGGRELASETR